MATIALSSSPAQLRLTGRGRVVLALAAFLAITAGVTAGAGSAFGGTEPVRTSSVLVESGDTLWSVARTLSPEADPRAVIADIRALNGLGADEPIVEGQRLAVPVMG